MEKDHSLPPSIQAARDRLLASGMLEETGEDDGRLVLSYPIEVKSQAVAVYVMLKASRATSSCWRQQSLWAGGRRVGFRR